MVSKNTNNPYPASGKDRHILQPVFGTHCATEDFSVKTVAQGSQHVHLEAVLTDPRARTWAVNKIVRDMQPGKGMVTRVTQIKSAVAFDEAIAVLSDFERGCRATPHLYGALYPDAQAMEFRHYKAFAEREGYVFDIHGMPQARPAHGLLPPGDFSQTDIQSAEENVQRPADEYDGHGPLSRIPSAHFLFDNFNRAAHTDDMNTRMTEMRIVNLLDKFHADIVAAHKKMEDYCATYTFGGQGQLMVDARDTLQSADITLRQLDAYGVDTAAFKSFTQQCRITSFILHAEGLYDLMNKGRGDFDENEAAFKYCVAQALDEFKKIDSSDDAVKTLQNMIVQTPKPEVPTAIRLFISNYRAERIMYDAKRRPPPSFKP